MGKCLPQDLKNKMCGRGFQNPSTLRLVGLSSDNSDCGVER